MNELFDKLTIRILITITMCLLIYVYRFIHEKAYQSFHKQLTNKFYPAKNTSDAVHFFARIMGVAIIFSSLTTSLSNGIWVALLDIFILSIISFIVYLVSIYIGESITLYNFEYKDEIHRRKNLAYAITSFAIVISQAIIIQKVQSIASHYIIVFLLVWIFSMVLYGLGAKSYRMITRLSFNRLIIQKNTAVAYSFVGYIWGITVLILASISHPLTEIKWYLIQCTLKGLLAIIICPFFAKGLVKIFNIVPSTKDDMNATDSTIGDGVFEGILFMCVALLTSAIINNINFSDFYPVF